MRIGLSPSPPEPDPPEPDAGEPEQLVLPPDRDTERWISEHARPHGALASALHRALRRFASDYDTDGWLGTHPMHVLGPASWRALLGEHARGGSLLDIGAGRGDVTATLAPLFDRVVATETSRPMIRRLRARGIEAHAVDLALSPLPGPARRFDAVALLHVLDRSARPRSLLRAARALVVDRGIAIVACPLPARPHVDVGPMTVDPDEPLGVEGETFDAARRSLFTMLAAEGWRARRWTRAVYRSRGDASQPGYALDDVIVVCAPSPQLSTQCASSPAASASRPIAR